MLEILDCLAFPFFPFRDDEIEKITEYTVDFWFKRKLLLSSFEFSCETKNKTKNDNKTIYCNLLFCIYFFFFSAKRRFPPIHVVSSTI